MKKQSLVLVVMLALLFVLTACQRSASQGSLFTPTAGSKVPTNVGGGTEDPMRMLQGYATQTALFSGTKPKPTATQTPLTNGTPATPTNTPIIPPTGIPGTQATQETPLTPTPQITIGTATPGRPATYTLMEGEFPICIARRFNVDPDVLMTLNSLSGNSFDPGLVLKIPQTGSFPVSRSLITHPATYTVLANETIYGIACKYGDVDPLQIAKLNSLVAPYTLKTGQSLNIP